MSNYLFIQSRDPISDRSVEKSLKLMSDLLKDAKQVTLFLVQEAVLLARNDVMENLLTDFLKNGGKVLVDEFSLQIREIKNLKENVKPAPVSVVIDALLEQQKVIWN